ncbi:MAG: hypothetical protein JNK82_05155 [Myxococcaceae bacterium]|nr:hypothetical protein [Myxococcaceae bacterium]
MNRAAERSKLLSGFKRLAETYLTPASGHRSLALSCWSSWGPYGNQVHTDLDVEGWGKGGSALHAFSAMCEPMGVDPLTEGYTEPYSQHSLAQPPMMRCTLAVARVDARGGVEVHWVGNLHRPLEDFPPGQPGLEYPCARGR